MLVRCFKILPLIVAISCSSSGKKTNKSPPDFTSEFKSQYGLYNIQASDAYEYLANNNKAVAGDGVKLAIIDSGVTINHPDIAANYNSSISYDYVNSDSDPNDDQGHGTHVASIAAGVKNGSGMHGVAYNSQIIAMKVLDWEGNGYSFNISDAIIDSSNNGAKVINLSLGSDKTALDIKNALLTAKNNDVLTVAAAGNESSAQVNYPARYAVDNDLQGYLLAVGSVNNANNISDFSNQCGSIRDFCLVAPGEDIYGAYNNGGYEVLSGTSMSTPHVSGAAAVLKGAWPHLSAPQLSEILLTTATDLGAAGTDDIYGKGLLNLNEAVRAQGQNLLGFGTSVLSKGYDLQATSMVSDPIFGDAFIKNVVPEIESAVFFDDFGRDYQANLQNRFQISIRSDIGSINLSNQNIANHIIPINLKNIGYNGQINFNISQFKDQSAKNGFGLKFLTNDNSIEPRPFSENGFSFTNNLKFLNPNLDIDFGFALNHDQISNIQYSEFNQEGRMGYIFNSNPFKSFLYQFDAQNTKNRSNFNQIFVGKEFFNKKIQITASSQSSSSNNNFTNSKNRQNQIFDLGLSYKDKINNNISLSLGQLTEFDNNILNSKSLGAFESGKNSKTSYLKLSLKRNLYSNLNLYFSIAEGFSKIAGNNYGIFRDFNNLRLRSLGVGISHNDFFGGLIGINYIEPMRVYSGSVKYDIAIARDIKGNVARKTGYASLKPQGKERDLELFFRKNFGNSSEANFGIMIQKNPGNIKDNPDNYVGFGYFSKEF